MQKLLVRIASIALLIVNSIAFAGDPPPAAGGEPPTLRLPPGARPTRYAVTLTVAPGDATAQGEIAIDVELDRHAPGAVAQRRHLDRARRHRRDGCDRVSYRRRRRAIRRARLRSAATGRASTASRSRSRRSSDELDARNLRAAGSRRLVRDDAVRGDLGAQGVPFVRRARVQDAWRLTLRVPRDLVAIANTQVESETVDGDGLKTVRFKPTRPLPTYLVAFAVGPWQSVDLGRLGAGATPSRIVVPRGPGRRHVLRSAAPIRSFSRSSSAGSAFRIRSTSSITSRSR